MYHLKCFKILFPHKSTIVWDCVGVEVGMLLIFHGKEQEGA